MRIPAAADEVEDGDAVRRDRGLREQAEAAGDLLRRQRRDLRAVETHRAGSRPHHPGERAQESGLPAGVGTHDHGESTVGDAHREALGNDPPVIGEGQLLTEQPG